MAEISIISISGIMIWIVVSAIIFGALKLLNNFDSRVSLLIAVPLGFLASFISSTFNLVFLRFSESMIFILVFFFFVILITKFVGVENFSEAIGGGKGKPMTAVLIVAVPALVIAVVLGSFYFNSGDLESESTQNVLSDGENPRESSQLVESSEQTRIGDSKSSSSVFGSATLGVLLLFVVGALMIAFLSN